NGKPAATPNHLTWRVEGPQAGEPVFVPGHPGTTNRLWTPAQLKMYRNTFIPAYLLRNTELRGRMIQWSKTGEEPARIVQENLLGLENGLKVYRGLHQALLSDGLVTQKSEQAQALRAQAKANSEFSDLFSNGNDPWAQI